MKKKKKTTGNMKKDQMRVTKKDLIIVFLVFFFVFMLVGYMRGRSDRHSIDRLRLDLTHTHKGYFKLGQDNKGRKQIIYACQNIKYLYDIDSDNPHQISSNDSLPEGTLLIEPAILSDRTILNSFVGGAASVWTVKELFTYIGLLSSEGSSVTSVIAARYKLVIAAILGTIAGYEVGRWIALRNEPRCDNEEYTKILDNREEWKLIEKAMWHGEYERVTKMHTLEECGSKDEGINHVQDKTYNDALTKLQRYQEGEVSIVGHNFSSADFDALYEFEAVEKDFIRVCGKHN